MRVDVMLGLCGLQAAGLDHTVAGSTVVHAVGKPHGKMPPPPPQCFGAYEGEAEKSESSTAPSNLEAHSGFFWEGIARKSQRHRV